MTDDDQAVDWHPPYISYVTLTNFIDEKLGANALPPRIDRGFLDNYAGSVQLQLLATLRTMGFVGERGELLEPLRRAARHVNDRKEVIGEWAEAFYEDQIALARQNATASMLWESFSRHKLSGSTLRKAVVFYLAVADDCGLPKSPHFKPPKQVVISGRTGKPVKRAAGTTRPVDPAEELPNATATPQPKGEQVHVTLGPAGKVDMFVDVQWLDLPDETFIELRRLIKALEALSYADPDRLPFEAESA